MATVQLNETLVPLIEQMGQVVKALIGLVVELITGDLLVLTIVTAFIVFIVGVVYLLLTILRNSTKQATNGVSSMKTRR